MMFDRFEKDLIVHLLRQHEKEIKKYADNETLQADVPLVESIKRKLEV